MAKNISTMPQFDRYAIFKTGGKQYQALEGKTIAIEKLNAQQGEIVTFDTVLLRKVDNKVEIGQPYLQSTVKAIVVKHDKGPKLVVFKFKRRKKYRKKTGHRQPITIIRVQSI